MAESVKPQIYQCYIFKEVKFYYKIRIIIPIKIKYSLKQCKIPDFYENLKKH